MTIIYTNILRIEKKIGLGKIKIYHIYNLEIIMLRSVGGGPEMHAITLINNFEVAIWSCENNIYTNMVL